MKVQNNILVNKIEVDGEPLIGMPPPKKTFLWPWPLTRWPSHCHQCHVHLLLIDCDQIH